MFLTCFFLRLDLCWIHRSAREGSIFFVGASDTSVIHWPTSNRRQAIEVRRISRAMANSKIKITADAPEKHLIRRKYAY